MAPSRLPSGPPAIRCTSSFSDSSVVNVKYSSSLTSVAYTAEQVPPSPYYTSPDDNPIKKSDVERFTTQTMADIKQTIQLYRKVEASTSKGNCRT